MCRGRRSRAAVAVSNPKPAGRRRGGHEEDEERAHPVVAEALPHLGEEERREAARDGRRTPCRSGQVAAARLAARARGSGAHGAYRDRMTASVMRALLISTYDLGHQPFGLASPAAWLRREGVDVRCADVAKERLSDADDRSRRDLIAFHLPMHTATRLAAPIIQKARALNPPARICAYGLYAPLNARVGCVRLAWTMCSAVSSKPTWRRSRRGLRLRWSVCDVRSRRLRPNARDRRLPKLHFHSSGSVGSAAAEPLCDAAPRRRPRR